MSSAQKDDLGRDFKQLFEQGAYECVLRVSGDAASRPLEDRLLRGRSLLKTGQASRAAEELEVLRSEAPDFWQHHYYAGCAHGTACDFASAIRCLDDAVKLAPTEPAGFLQRGHAYLKSERLIDAAENYLLAVQVGGTGEATEALANAGILLAQRKDYEAACRALSSAYAAGHDSDAVLFHWGWSSFHLKRYGDCGQAWSLLTVRQPLDQLDIPILQSLADLEILPEKLVERASLLATLGRREEAIELCERHQREMPTDGTVAHALFVTCYWDFVANDRCPEAADRLIRNAVLLLNLDDFWLSWEARCRAVYGCEVDGNAIVECRRRLRQLLTKKLPIDTAAGRRLRTELAGATALSDAGGLPNPNGDGSSVAMGPLMVQHLSLTNELADLFRRIHHKQIQSKLTHLVIKMHQDMSDGFFPDFEEDTDDVSLLARYFSQLSDAQVLIESGRVEEALVALGQASCERCAENSAREVGGVTICICQGKCRDFIVLNPAYAWQSDRNQTLFREAALVAGDAHLKMAESQMMGKESDWDKCNCHWRKALEVARAADVEDDVADKLAQRALGKAGGLTEGRNPAMDRITMAVEVLERARDVIGDDCPDKLGTGLAECLHRRATRCVTEEDWDGAGRDLRRAREVTALTPSLAEHSLSVLIRNATDSLDEKPLKSAELLTEAETVLTAGLAQFPNQDKLHELRGYMRSVVFETSTRLLDKGKHTADEGEYYQAYQQIWTARELLCTSHKTSFERVWRNRFGRRGVMCEIGLRATMERICCGDHATAEEVSLNLLRDYSGELECLPIGLLAAGQLGLQV